MKKNIIVACMVLSAIAFYAFTTPTASNTKASANTTISTSDISTVSVCKITNVGTSATAENCSFTGKYDDETGYITIYNNRKEEVASGKVRENRETRGKKKNYSHCLQNTYFFNL